MRPLLLARRGALSVPTSTPPVGQGGKHVSIVQQATYEPPNQYGLADYYITGEWAARQAAIDLSIPVFSYSASITATNSYFKGLTQTEALAGGYELRTAGGTILTNASYQPSVLCDPGNSGYQQAWLNKVINQIKVVDGAQGVFIDDCVIYAEGISGNLTPALYPTQASWFAAMNEFIHVVGPALQAAGLQVMPNLGCYSGGTSPWNYDNGEASQNWGAMVAPYVTHIAVEYGLQTWDGNETIRIMGPDWRQHWDGWAGPNGVISAIENAGANYVGLAQANPADSADAIYLKASMLLFMNRPGSSIMFVYDNIEGILGPKMRKDMGSPSGPATLNGQVWTRNFANGVVTVNPWTQTASIT